jgi:hypothetical protein
MHIKIENQLNLNMKKTIILIAVALVVLLSVIYTATSISYTNKEAGLRAAIEAKVEANKSNYTKMFEVLVNEAGVAAQYADDFKEIYPKLVEGRYNHGGGQMMQWIQEHNPQFDTSLYKQVMTSIEAQRESFHTTQVELIDLSRQHNTLLKKFPGNWFLSDVPPIKIPVIVNDATDKAFKSGKEAMPELFPRKKKDSIK